MDLINNFVDYLRQLYDLLVSFSTSLKDCLSWLPGEVYLILSLGILAAVFLKILGRES